MRRRCDAAVCGQERPRSSHVIPRSLALLVTLLCVSPVLAACGSSGDPPPPPASQGIVQNRAIPDIPLISSAGAATSLAAYRGKYIVMAPFLTLCQDECPLVTGAFIASADRDSRSPPGSATEGGLHGDSAHRPPGAKGFMEIT